MMCETYISMTEAPSSKKDQEHGKTSRKYTVGY